MSKLCFIILNWNWFNKTKICLDSLFSSNKDFEIYLLDNWSSGNEFELLKKRYLNESRLHLFHSDINLWFTGWVNFCIEKAKEKKYEWYCLLNNDTLLDWEFLKKLHLLIWVIPNSIWIFWPRILHANKPEIIQSEGGKISLWTWICPWVNEGAPNNESSDEFQDTDYVSGCCFFIKWALLKAVWILDDSFFAYYEEVDYCIRVRKLGYKIGVFTHLQIHHDQSSSSNSYTGLWIFLMMRNRILFLKKHSKFLQYVLSYIYLLPYSLYFRIKYGWTLFFYFRMGVIEWILGYDWNPFLTHDTSFFTRKTISSI